MSKSIFIAFSGTGLENYEKIYRLKWGYQCWNLKKMTYDQFLQKIKRKIPPINDTILNRHYKIAEGIREHHGLSKSNFEKASWGIFIPESLDDVTLDGFSESIFLINLFSPKFLYPMFYVTDFGITSQLENLLKVFISFPQNQFDKFNSNKFPIFFRSLMHQSIYALWQRDRITTWDKEDWRLYVASNMYLLLQTYDEGKSSFMWQRESADMSIILESLFTAEDNTNEEVGYRLRKRVAVMLSEIFPEIESEIKKLYDMRSSFVHGSFFKEITKHYKKKPEGTPIPDFASLYKQKEYIRTLLIGYLILTKQLRGNKYSGCGCETVIQLLEKSIIDLNLRKVIVGDLKIVYKLMDI